MLVFHPGLVDVRVAVAVPVVVVLVFVFDVAVLMTVMSVAVRQLAVAVLVVMGAQMGVVFRHALFLSPWWCVLVGLVGGIWPTVHNGGARPWMLDMTQGLVGRADHARIEQLIHHVRVLPMTCGQPRTRKIRGWCDAAACAIATASVNWATVAGASPGANRIRTGLAVATNSAVSASTGVRGDLMAPTHSTTGMRVSIRSWACRTGARGGVRCPGVSHGADLRRPRWCRRGGRFRVCRARCRVRSGDAGGHGTVWL